MKALARARRDRIRAQLADLKMPGALEALDEVLAPVDGGATASEAIEELLGAQITLRNNRRLQARCARAVCRRSRRWPTSTSASSPRSSASRSTRSTSSASSSGGRT